MPRPASREALGRNSLLLRVALQSVAEKFLIVCASACEKKSILDRETIDLDVPFVCGAHHEFLPGLIELVE
jgi:hypothetical protein